VIVTRAVVAPSPSRETTSATTAVPMAMRLDRCDDAEHTAHQRIEQACVDHDA